MWSAVKSLIIWLGVALLVLCWLPMLAIRRFFDRDRAHYHTGKLFRKLGKLISRMNPNWKLSISGKSDINDRRPYVIVCNHLSQADIPLISNLPWEMKWVAKKELFDLPIMGWMMKLAGDISVDRSAANRKKTTFSQARYYLKHRCSVMFFPEGTRSRNGELKTFAKGAFELAISEQVSILPLVIDGTQNTLPKKSWKFGVAKHIKLKVLNPVSVKGYAKNDISKLTEEVRDMIANQLHEWRNVDHAEVEESSS